MHLSKLIPGSIILAILALASCQGPAGVPGPPGPQGNQGPAAPLALMYEIEYNLTPANSWQVYYDFPTKDEIFPEDVVLVYRFAGRQENLDVWRPMPVSQFNQRGTLVFNYDFTVRDVRLFAEASYALNAQDIFNNQAARIVVVPADFSPNGRRAFEIDYNNYEQVKKAFNLPDTPTRKLTRIQ